MTAGTRRSNSRALPRSRSARLGFNRPRIPFSNYETWIELRGRYIAHGLPPGMADIAVAVPYVDLWMPPLQELMVAGVITAWKGSAGQLEGGEAVSSD